LEGSLRGPGRWGSGRGPHARSHGCRFSRGRAPVRRRFSRDLSGRGAAGASRLGGCRRWMVLFETLVGCASSREPRATKHGGRFARWGSRRCAVLSRPRWLWACVDRAGRSAADRFSRLGSPAFRSVAFVGALGAGCCSMRSAFGLRVVLAGLRRVGRFAQLGARRCGFSRGVGCWGGAGMPVARCVSATSRGRVPQGWSGTRGAGRWSRGEGCSASCHWSATSLGGSRLRARPARFRRLLENDRPTRGSRELEVGRDVSGWNAKGFAGAPLWHIRAPHFETAAVRRPSGAAFSSMTYAHNDPGALYLPAPRVCGPGSESRGRRLHALSAPSRAPPQACVVACRPPRRPGSADQH